MRLSPALLCSISGVALAAPNLSDERAAEAAAAEAAAVHGRHCSDAAGDEAVVAGAAISEVADSWQRVGEEYELNPTASLLHWRGLLAECLGKEGSARHDYELFLQLHGDDPLHAEPARETRRRLARLGVRQAAPRAARSDTKLRRGLGFAIGGGLAAGAAGAGVAAGVRWSDMQDAWQRYHSGNLARGEFAGVDAEGSRAAQDTTGWTVAASGLAVGAVVGLVVGALPGPANASPSWSTRAPRRPVVQVAPAGLGVVGWW